LEVQVWRLQELAETQEQVQEQVQVPQLEEEQRQEEQWK